MKKLEKETQKAVIQIPKEIEKLTKVIAVIGETFFNTKIRKLEQSKKDFEELVKEENKRGVT